MDPNVQPATSTTDTPPAQVTDTPAADTPSPPPPLETPQSITPSPDIAQPLASPPPPATPISLSTEPAPSFSPTPPTPPPPPVQNDPPYLDPPVNTFTPSDQGRKFYQSKAFLVIAIVTGAGLLSLPFMLSQINRSEPVTNTETQATTPAPPVQPFILTIESPTDETVVTNNIVTIKGKTLPNITVMYYTETDDGTLESDVNGNFEATLTLVDGINTLTIMAFAENGEEKSVTLSIIYDSES